MIKAVIFDMDGVIIDSEPLWEKSEAILLERNGLGSNAEYRKEYRKKIMGLNQKASVALLKKSFDLPHTPEEIQRERLEILLELYEKELRLVDGIEELLRAVKSDWNMKTALASESPMRIIESVLGKFFLEDAFEVKMSGECVETGKPHPGIYLETARRLGVAPEECAAVEDSINGILSAKAAGMRCVAVPDPKIAEEEHFPADVVRKTVLEIRLDDVTGSR